MIIDDEKKREERKGKIRKKGEGGLLSHQIALLPVLLVYSRALRSSYGDGDGDGSACFATYNSVSSP